MILAAAGLLGAMGSALAWSSARESRSSTSSTSSPAPWLVVPRLAIADLEAPVALAPPPRVLRLTADATRAIQCPRWAGDGQRVELRGAPTGTPIACRADGLAPRFAALVAAATGRAWGMLDYPRADAWLELDEPIPAHFAPPLPERGFPGGSGLLVVGWRGPSGRRYWGDAYGRELPPGSHGSTSGGSWGDFIERAGHIGDAAIEKLDDLRSAIGDVTNSPLWDLAQGAAWYIPGIGPAVSAGMAVAAALGRGESLEDLALAAARGALPAAAVGAWDAAIGVARAGGDPAALVDALPERYRGAARLAARYTEGGPPPTERELAELAIAEAAA